MFEKIFVILAQLILIHGFFRHSNNPKLSGRVTKSSVPFLTLSEFSERTLPKQNLEGLKVQSEHARLDTENPEHCLDKTIALLTSRLQQKFTDFENQLSSLLDKYTTLENDFSALLYRYSIQESEMADLRNKALNFEKYKELNKVDVCSLQQKLETLSSQTLDLHLSVNENARNQDVLALFNITKEIQNNIKNLDIANTAMDIKVEKLEKGLNSTNMHLQQQITEKNEEVALTSCSNISYTQILPGGSIIKFSDIVTNVGVMNISEFQNSGKFICDKPGIYQISVYIGTDASASTFNIYNNGNYVSRVYDNESGWRSNTEVVALVLQKGDTVWVQIDSQMTVNQNRASCITIVKIK